eukprot:CAMPEP_0119070706 /NCGR_PEP_ID=MMETSP1178-20130426/42888_1 /TAXON_ID=33656 /ORGANISM="unid sp, Strain CCMP2000" /LENGTH=176 /DNA_ID=CAMNT_0007052563 /DNA_START=190 /DNA_END=721 /DNA_ORIENTATION=-
MIPTNGPPATSTSGAVNRTALSRRRPVGSLVWPEAALVSQQQPRQVEHSDDTCSDDRRGGLFLAVRRLFVKAQHLGAPDDRSVVTDAVVAPVKVDLQLAGHLGAGALSGGRQTVSPGPAMPPSAAHTPKLANQRQGAPLAFVFEVQFSQEALAAPQRLESRCADSYAAHRFSASPS